MKSLRSCTGRCSTLALTPAIRLRSRTSPTTRSKTTSPHPFEARLDNLMAGRHTSLSHYCRLTTRHSDRRLDTSRSLHSVSGCRITLQSLHSVFGYRISRPASGYTFTLCIWRLFICFQITTLGGNGSRHNTARRLVIRITIPYWADTVHGRTKHGVCFPSFSFLFLLFCFASAFDDITITHLTGCIMASSVCSYATRTELHVHHHHHYHRGRLM